MGALRLKPSGVALHGPEHEALWGLAGARATASCSMEVMCFVELVQYLESRRQTLATGDTRVSDQVVCSTSLRLPQDARPPGGLSAHACGGRPAERHAAALPQLGRRVRERRAGFQRRVACRSRPRWDGQMGFLQRTDRQASAAGHPRGRADRADQCQRGPGLGRVGRPPRHAAVVPLDTVTLEREGQPGPNGVGAERVMRARRRTCANRSSAGTLRGRCAIAFSRARQSLATRARSTSGRSPAAARSRGRSASGQRSGYGGIARRAVEKLLDGVLPRLKALAERG